MRSLLLVSAAVLGLSSVVHAGEGNGEPFPGPDASVTTTIVKPVYAHKNQDPFQFYASGASTSMKGYKPLPNKSQDPYPFHAPDSVIALRAPVTGPESGTAAASTGQRGTTPMAQHSATGRGGNS